MRIVLKIVPKTLTFAASREIGSPASGVRRAGL
jgi:hypothetical protein